MPELKSLATIIEHSNRKIWMASFVYKFQVLKPDKSWDYFEAWRGSTQSPSMRLPIYGEKADSFGLACDNLLTTLQLENHDLTDIVTINEFPHHEEIENLISQLQEETTSHDKYPSLGFNYRPPFDHYEAKWGGGLTVGNRWQSYVLAEVSGQSLYKVCLDLWEKFRNVC